LGRLRIIFYYIKEVVRGSVQDTLAVAEHLKAELEGRPLHGIADCYGAIPLLRTAAARPGIFAGVVLYSPVPSLRYLVGVRDGLRNYFAPDGRPRLRNPFDLRGFLLATNEVLFPEVEKSRDHFGILRYDDTAGLAMLRDFLFWSPLARVRLPGLSAKVVYGRADEVLGVATDEGEKTYRRALERVLPEAEFATTDEADHFWTGCGEVGIRIAVEFLSRHSEPRASRSEAGVPAAAAVGRAS
jgi:hypothetical protein